MSATGLLLTSNTSGQQQFFTASAGHKTRVDWSSWSSLIAQRSGVGRSGLSQRARRGPRQADPKTTMSGGTRPDASARNPTTTKPAIAMVGAASEASVALVVAMSTQDAITMAPDAPRT